MPSIWCDCAPWRANGSSCTTRRATQSRVRAQGERGGVIGDINLGVSGQRRDTIWYKVSRRTLDLIGSLLLLAFTLPLLLLVAFLIKVDSRGPVLYRQSRVGLHGRIFTMLKFRSMSVDAEAAGPRWAINGDPRVTRIGAFIRATRLDEVPQLLNVLRGEMSLVGPRPERPHFVQQLEKTSRVTMSERMCYPESPAGRRSTIHTARLWRTLGPSWNSICSISTTGRCYLICASLLGTIPGVLSRTGAR